LRRWRFDASAGCSEPPAQGKEKMRILADTSIWINHFRRSDSQLVQALSQQQVVIHPIVIGELATGNLRDRPGILSDLQALPHVQEVTFTESLNFLEIHQLYARGLGWSDIQLLASALLNGVSLWVIRETT
jgi:predicted nucleic acid-binding protein